MTTKYNKKWLDTPKKDKHNKIIEIFREALESDKKLVIVSSWKAGKVRAVSMIEGLRIDEIAENLNNILNKSFQNTQSSS